MTPLALLAVAAAGIPPARAAAPGRSSRRRSASSGSTAISNSSATRDDGGLRGADATDARSTLEAVLTAAGGRADPAAPDAIELRRGEVPGVTSQCEAYRLEVAPGRVRVTAQVAAGLRYGVETLRQLVRREHGAPRPASRASASRTRRPSPGAASCTMSGATRRTSNCSSGSST